jgi:hypothetical protein
MLFRRSALKASRGDAFLAIYPHFWQFILSSWSWCGITGKMSQKLAAPQLPALKLGDSVERLARHLWWQRPEGAATPSSLRAHALRCRRRSRVLPPCGKKRHCGRALVAPALRPVPPSHPLTASVRSLLWGRRACATARRGRAVDLSITATAHCPLWGRSAFATARHRRALPHR